MGKNIILTKIISIILTVCFTVTSTPAYALRPQALANSGKTTQKPQPQPALSAEKFTQEQVQLVDGLDIDKALVKSIPADAQVMEKPPASSKALPTALLLLTAPLLLGAKSITVITFLPWIGVAIAIPLFLIFAIRPMWKAAPKGEKGEVIGTAAFFMALLIVGAAWLGITDKRSEQILDVYQTTSQIERGLFTDEVLFTKEFYQMFSDINVDEGPALGAQVDKIKKAQTRIEKNKSYIIQYARQYKLSPSFLAAIQLIEQIDMSTKVGEVVLNEENIDWAAGLLGANTSVGTGQINADTFTDILFPGEAWPEMDGKKTEDLSKREIIKLLLNDKINTLATAKYLAHLRDKELTSAASMPEEELMLKLAAAYTSSYRNRPTENLPLPLFTFKEYMESLENDEPILTASIYAHWVKLGREHLIRKRMFTTEDTMPVSQPQQSIKAEIDEAQKQIAREKALQEEQERLKQEQIAQEEQAQALAQAQAQKVAAEYSPWRTMWGRKWYILGFGVFMALVWNALGSEQKKKESSNQIGKRAVVKEVITRDNKIYLQLVDAKNTKENLGEIGLEKAPAYKRASLIYAVRKLIEGAQEEYRDVLGEFLTMLLRAPPIYTYKERVTDFFGYASSKPNFIAVHEDLLSNPVSLFHEIAHYIAHKDPSIIDAMEAFLDDTGEEFLDRHSEGYKKDRTHYVIRAFTRQVFAKEDLELTQKIKAMQQPVSKPEAIKIPDIDLGALPELPNWPDIFSDFEDLTDDDDNEADTEPGPEAEDAQPLPPLGAAEEQPSSPQSGTEEPDFLKEKEHTPPQIPKRVYGYKEMPEYATTLDLTDINRDTIRINDTINDLIEDQQKEQVLYEFNETQFNAIVQDMNTGMFMLRRSGISEHEKLCIFARYILGKYLVGISMVIAMEVLKGRRAGPMADTSAEEARRDTLNGLLQDTFELLDDRGNAVFGAQASELKDICELLTICSRNISLLDDSVFNSLRTCSYLIDNNVHIYMKKVTRRIASLGGYVWVSFLSAVCHTIKDKRLIDSETGEGLIYYLGDRIDVIDDDVNALGFTYNGEKHGVVLSDTTRSKLYRSILPVLMGRRLRGAHRINILIQTALLTDYGSVRKKDADKVAKVQRTMENSTAIHEDQHTRYESSDLHNAYRSNVFMDSVLDEALAYLASIWRGTSRDNNGEYRNKLPFKYRDAVTTQAREEDQFDAPFTDLLNILELYINKPMLSIYSILASDCSDMIVVLLCRRLNIGMSIDRGYNGRLQDAATILEALLDDEKFPTDEDKKENLKQIAFDVARWVSSGEAEAIYASATTIPSAPETAEEKTPPQGKRRITWLVIGGILLAPLIAIVAAFMSEFRHAPDTEEPPLPITTRQMPKVPQTKFDNLNTINMPDNFPFPGKYETPHPQPEAPRLPPNVDLNNVIDGPDLQFFLLDAAKTNKEINDAVKKLQGALWDLGALTPGANREKTTDGRFGLGTQRALNYYHTEAGADKNVDEAIEGLNQILRNMRKSQSAPVAPASMVIPILEGVKSMPAENEVQQNSILSAHKQSLYKHLRRNIGKLSFEMPAYEASFKEIVEAAPTAQTFYGVNNSGIIRWNQNNRSGYIFSGVGESVNKDCRIIYHSEITGPDKAKEGIVLMYYNPQEHAIYICLSGAEWHERIFPGENIQRGDYGWDKARIKIYLKKDFSIKKLEHLADTQMSLSRTTINMLLTDASISQKFPQVYDSVGKFLTFRPVTDEMREREARDNAIVPLSVVGKVNAHPEDAADSDIRTLKEFHYYKSWLVKRYALSALRRLAEAGRISWQSYAATEREFVEYDVKEDINFIRRYIIQDPAIITKTIYNVFGERVKIDEVAGISIEWFNRDTLKNVYKVTFTMKNGRSYSVVCATQRVDPEGIENSPQQINRVTRIWRQLSAKRYQLVPRLGTTRWYVDYKPRITDTLVQSSALSTSRGTDELRESQWIYNNIYFIFREFIEGRDLSEIMQDKGVSAQAKRGAMRTTLKTYCAFWTDTERLTGRHLFIDDPKPANVVVNEGKNQARLIDLDALRVSKDFADMFRTLHTYPVYRDAGFDFAHKKGKAVVIDTAAAEGVKPMPQEQETVEAYAKEHVYLTTEQRAILETFTEDLKESLGGALKEKLAFAIAYILAAGENEAVFGKAAEIVRSKKELAEQGHTLTADMVMLCRDLRRQDMNRFRSIRHEILKRNPQMFNGGALDYFIQEIINDFAHMMDKDLEARLAQGKPRLFDVSLEGIEQALQENKFENARDILFQLGHRRVVNHVFVTMLNKEIEELALEPANAELRGKVLGMLGSDVGPMPQKDKPAEGVKPMPMEEEKPLQLSPRQAVTRFNETEAMAISRQIKRELKLRKTGNEPARMRNFYYGLQRYTIERWGRQINEPLGSNEEALWEIYFIRVGPLFFLEQEEYEKLSVRLKKTIGVNVILIDQIEDTFRWSDSAILPIITMLNKDIANKRFIDCGAGDGLLSVVALKLGAAFACLIENASKKPYAKRLSTQNGYSDGVDFAFYDMNLKEYDDIAERLNLETDPLETVVMSNIGNWDDEGWATNLDSINLIKFIPQASLFIASGYVYDVRKPSYIIDAEKARIKSLGFEVEQDIAMSVYDGGCFSSWSATRPAQAGVKPMPQEDLTPPQEVTTPEINFDAEGLDENQLQQVLNAQKRERFVEEMVSKALERKPEEISIDSVKISLLSYGRLNKYSYVVKIRLKTGELVTAVIKAYKFNRQQRFEKEIHALEVIGAGNAPECYGSWVHIDEGVGKNEKLNEHSYMLFAESFEAGVPLEDYIKSVKVSPDYLKRTRAAVFLAVKKYASAQQRSGNEFQLININPQNIIIQESSDGKLQAKIVDTGGQRPGSNPQKWLSRIEEGLLAPSGHIIAREEVFSIIREILGQQFLDEALGNIYVPLGEAATPLEEVKRAIQQRPSAAKTIPLGATKRIDLDKTSNGIAEAIASQA